MEFVYTKQFKKQHKKLPKKSQAKLAERLLIMSNDEFNPILNNHKLQGDFAACYSINISGDMRLVYSIDGNYRVLLSIGTHSKLYGK